MRVYDIGEVDRKYYKHMYVYIIVKKIPLYIFILIFFLGVTGSPWTVEVMEGSGTRVAVLGDTIKHFPAGQLSAFDISAANVSKEDIQVHIVSKLTITF